MISCVEINVYIAVYMNIESYCFYEYRKYSFTKISPPLSVDFRAMLEYLCGSFAEILIIL